MGNRFLIFLDRFHWLWLILAAPFLLFPSPTRSLAMLVVPALLLLRWKVMRAKGNKGPGDGQAKINHPAAIMPITPLNGVLVLMMLMVLASLWATYDISYSLPKISGMVLGIGIFYAFVRAGQTPRGWWLGFLIFLGIGVGIAAIGVVGTHWIRKISFLTPVISRLAPRITGLPGAKEGFHPNTVAGALLWVIPSLLAFFWLLLGKVKAIRNLIGGVKTYTIIVLMAGAILWTMAVFLLTQSRDGYISLALVFPVLILIALPRKLRWYGLAFLALLAIISGILIVSRWETVHAWLVNSNLFSVSALSMESFTERIEVWSRAIYGIQDFPFTGMGMNTFRKVMPVLYPIFNFPPDFDIGHAHNEFLQAALDLGIPGLISFFALYIIAFWMLIRTWKSVRINFHTQREGDNISVQGFKSGSLISAMDISPAADERLIRMTTIGLGGGLLAHLLWGLTDAISLGARPGFLLWIILGLISGLHQQADEQIPRVE